ncbi:hypothetical protein V9T40_011539 [Parthenolecanium corni]|uniref:Uncharacterized protein n=1 Tax=Parthenolecanium corni TaxID=536013 RepID=A0AAN9XZL3_9HEMI
MVNSFAPQRPIVAPTPAEIPTCTRQRFSEPPAEVDELQDVAIKSSETNLLSKAKVFVCWVQVKARSATSPLGRTSKGTSLRFLAAYRGTDRLGSAYRQTPLCPTDSRMIKTGSQ